MNRPIKFRGKRIDNEEWVEGSFIPHNEHIAYIVEIPDFWKKDYQYHIKQRKMYEVHPDTVGQFTEVLDDNEKEVCEGDLVKANDAFIDAVIFDNGGFIFEGREPQTQGTQIVAWNHLEVIGTIHDK